MTDLIKINNTTDTPTVSGRALHEGLGINSNYSTWFKRMCEYGFSEGKDFKTCFPNLESEIHGGQNKTDHQLTLSMAKELCMIQRNEIGRKFRQYFIEVEQQWNSPEAIMARALKLSNSKILALESSVKTLETQIAADRPKTLFADAVSVSNTSILIGELAKILKQNGHDIGQNRFFEWLRANGYLISRRGTDYNMPTQKSMNLGLFEIKETVISHSDGHTSISKTPKVTGKGQIYFINIFCCGKKK